MAEEQNGPLINGQSTVTKPKPISEPENSLPSVEDKGEKSDISSVVKMRNRSMINGQSTVTKNNQTSKPEDRPCHSYRKNSSRADIISLIMKRRFPWPRDKMIQ